MNAWYIIFWTVVTMFLPKFTWCVQTYQEEAEEQKRDEEDMEIMGESIRSERR